MPTKFLNIYFTIFFYESLNKKSQAKQMDNLRVSKDTVVLPRWEMETWKGGFIKRVDTGPSTTMKDLETPA